MLGVSCNSRQHTTALLPRQRASERRALPCILSAVVRSCEQVLRQTASGAQAAVGEHCVQLTLIERKRTSVHSRAMRAKVCLMF